MASLDEETVRRILAEWSDLPSNDLARRASTGPGRADLDDGEDPRECQSRRPRYKQGGWGMLGLPAELGGIAAPPTVVWAAQEMLLGANTTALFYAGGESFARILFEEGTDEQKDLPSFG